MNIVTSVGGLISSINNKVDTITSVANGILCLPYILTEGIGGLINSAINNLAAALSNIANGILGMVNSLVSAAINRVLGVVNRLLGKILGIFNLIKSIINAAKALLDRIRKAIFDRDNCRFAAAGLFKCIIGEVNNNILKRDVVGLTNNSLNSLIADKTQSIANTITQPGQLVDRYVNKAATMASKASSTINAIQLF